MSFEFESARHGGARYFRSLGIVGFAAAFTLVVAVAAPANAKVMPCGDLASGSPGSCVHPLVVPLGSRFTRSGPRAPVPLAENSALWVENGFILANANTNDAFGTATAISGDTAIVGAPGVNGDGAAFVLSREQGVWTGDVEFTASDLTGGADFGAAVAIDGNTAVVGAPDADVGGNSLQGKVYVFERSGGVWTGTAELTASDGALYDFFGQTVAVSGSSIIVGSVPAADDEMGRAYIFDRSGNTWVQSAELTATDEGNYDSFGDAVALDGTTALIGAKTVNLYQGAAYVFSENNGVWSQSAKLTGDPSQTDDQFGWSLAVAGSTAMVGAPGDIVGGNLGEGAVYVFSDSGGSWARVAKLKPKNGVGGEVFGTSIGLSGASAVIGAPGYPEAPDYGPGAAYVFDGSGGMWSQATMLLQSQGSSYDEFGTAVALTDDSAVLVGAPGMSLEYNGQGACYFYGKTDLALTVSAPKSVGTGASVASQVIVTNESSVATPAVAITATVPEYTTLSSVNSTQGDCQSGNGLVACELGSIAANGGRATANLMLQVTKLQVAPGTQFENSATVVAAPPPLAAGAETKIDSGGGGSGGGGGGSFGLLGLAAFGLLGRLRRKR